MTGKSSLIGNKKIFCSFVIIKMSNNNTYFIEEIEKDWRNKHKVAIINEMVKGKQMDIMKTKVCKNKHEVNTNDYNKEEKDIKRKYRINQYRNISEENRHKNWKNIKGTAVKQNIIINQFWILMILRFKKIYFTILSIQQT